MPKRFTIRHPPPPLSAEDVVIDEMRVVVGTTGAGFVVVAGALSTVLSSGESTGGGVSTGVEGGVAAGMCGGPDVLEVVGSGWTTAAFLLAPGTAGEELRDAARLVLVVEATEDVESTAGSVDIGAVVAFEFEYSPGILSGKHCDMRGLDIPNNFRVHEGFALSSSLPRDASICRSTSMSTSLSSFTPVFEAPASCEHAPASSAHVNQPQLAWNKLIDAYHKQQSG